MYSIHNYNELNSTENKRPEIPKRNVKTIFIFAIALETQQECHSITGKTIIWYTGTHIPTFNVHV